MANSEAKEEMPPELEGVEFFGERLARDNDTTTTSGNGAVNIDLSLARRVGAQYLSDKSKCISLCFLLLNPPLAAQKYALQIRDDRFFPDKPNSKLGDKVLWSLLHTGSRLRGFNVQLLCALHLIGCHKVIKKLLPHLPVTREWILNHFDGHETSADIGLNPFAVNLFKFCDSFSSFEEAAKFFRSCDLPEDSFSSFDNQYYELPLLQLVCNEVLKPEKPLDSKILDTLPGHRARDYLEAATNPRPKSGVVRKGLALIINQQTFTDDKGQRSTRKGTEKDVENLKFIWQKFGCDVIVKTDLDKNDFLDSLDEFVERLNAAGNEYDYSVLFILSHGQYNARTGSDEVLDINWNGISVDDIVHNRVMARCVGMRDKPKLFFIQACRSQADLHNRSREALPKSDDVSREALPLPATSSIVSQFYVIANSTVKRSASHRDEKEGSIFVRSLYEVLNEIGATKDICSCFEETVYRVRWHLNEQNAVFEYGFPYKIFLSEKT